MTLYIAIDESGNTSENGTRFFVIAAIMTNRTRNLLHTSKLLSNHDKEMKYYNSKDEDSIDILSSISKTNSHVMYVAVDKYDYKSKFYKMSGNNLYQSILKQLIVNISDHYRKNDAKIMIDETSQVRPESLFKISDECSMNVLSFKKYVSSTNKCIQIADFVAGAIFSKYEHNNDEHYRIIEKIVLCP